MEVRNNHEGKKLQFPSTTTLLQHCESSNNWHHMMLANYLKGAWAPGACEFEEPKSPIWHIERPG